MLKNEEIEYFTRSKLAKKVLEKINEQEFMAKILASELETYRESVSRILLHLEKLKLAECTKPKSSNFRPYKITSRGKLVLKELASKKY
jgi:predicted XRE-type DNA-binding protein